MIKWKKINDIHVLVCGSKKTKQTCEQTVTDETTILVKFDDNR